MSGEGRRCLQEAERGRLGATIGIQMGTVAFDAFP